VRVQTPKGPVSVAIEMPDEGEPKAPVVVLAHGAGSDMNHPSVVGVSDGIRAAGFPTVRFNFPYREDGRRAPDRQPVLLEAWRAVLTAVRNDRQLMARPIVVGGRSMGGRMASLLVAEGEAVAGIVLLAFPLHPPKRVGTERAAHLARITAPMLFVQGTRDALASWDLMEPLVRGLPTATLHVVESGDHGFRVPKRVASAETVLAGVVGGVVDWLRAARTTIG